MADKVKSLDAVQKDTRVRRISLEPIQMNRCLDTVVNFGHLAISFTPMSNNVRERCFSVVKITSGKGTAKFDLEESVDDWQATVRMIARWEDSDDGEANKVVQVEEFELKMSNDQPTTKLSCKLLYLELVQIDLEFLLLDGLGFLPLRDYSVVDKYSNITLLVEGQKFELNKEFLLAHSSYFEKLFHGEFSEKNQKEIELKEVSAEAFTNLLDVLTHTMYQIHRKAAIFDLLKLADQFDVPEVFRRMEVMLINNYPYNLLNKGEMLWVADKYHNNMQTLMMHPMALWEKGDCEKFLTPEIFEDLRPNTVMTLLKRFA